MLQTYGSQDNAKRRVAFFMRKGADCLSKWVGESERQLRMLFDQAYQMRPSIIFFDEIDGEHFDVCPWSIMFCFTDTCTKLAFFT